MYRSRVIPCLLLRGNGLVKTRQFKRAVYVGDPVNAAKIFSDKEADELVLLDIDASREGRELNYELIAEIAGECFMPLTYGGGVRTIEQVRRLLRLGIEKIVINSAATRSLSVISQAAHIFGNQAIVAGIDVHRTFLGGYEVMANSATITTKLKLNAHIHALIDAGAGEIFLNHIDRDGMMCGYDLDLVRRVTQESSVPVVACGGAGTIEHLVQAVREAGASAVCAGSLFVFHGKHRAVLINYPHNLMI